MSKLIEADKLRDAMFHYYGCVNENTNKSNYKGETLMDYEVAELIDECISTAPTVDAVEVVRCKDCKFLRTHIFAVDGFIKECKYYCSYRAISFGPIANAYEFTKEYEKLATTLSDFCSHGERKEE